MSKDIIVINDTIDDFIHKFSFNSKDIYNLYVYSLMDFLSLKSELSLSKSTTIVIMSEKLRNKTNRKKLKKYFDKKFGFINPQTIYLFKDEVDTKHAESIIKEESNSIYLYSEKHLNDPVFFLNFHEFINELYLKILYSFRVDEYIVKSFQIMVDTEIIKTQKEQIELMSRIDYLTNTLNRRALFNVIEKEKERTSRNLRRLKKINKKYPSFTNAEDMVNDFIIYSCIMLDIDFFKNINDTYGHLTGDEVLKRIGELINSNHIFRENDIAGRYGGEEFIILLPGTNAECAFISAERLRKVLKQENFLATGGKTFRITVSIGISEFYYEDEKTEDILERADMALYHAKASGRDQTVIYEKLKSSGHTN